jgi:soluble lytic murein transglycosylase-like protein
MLRFPLVAAPTAVALWDDPALCAEPFDSQTSICLMIESSAQANGLPAEFFARVIWQESRFDADAVGPVTRSGARAQGIAQFMPGTAAERQLLDPFDPVQALPKAAEFLHDLRAEFGNLGLDAAAYNAGPRRVREWLAGTGRMPAQTRAYVAAVTGHDIEQWKDAKDGARDPKPTDCRTLIALLRREPNAFVAALEQRVRTEASHPWGVQLAASFSRERALTAYGRTMTRFATALRDRDPIIQRRLLRSRGTRPMYQVRIGADTRAEAERLCGRLRAAGGACLVLRNSGRS